MTLRFGNPRHREAEANEILRALAFGEERAAACVQEALEALSAENGVKKQEGAPLSHDRDFPLTQDDIAQALRRR